MTIMITEVYDALLSAGAPEEKARNAAEVLADYDVRLHRIERRLTLLTWQVAGLYALVGPMLWLVIRVAAKVGAL
jgi:hypothetical protein